MAAELAEDEGRAAEMRRSIDAVNAVRAGLIGNPAIVDAAATAEAALKMGAGPRSADFARVRSASVASVRCTTGADMASRHANASASWRLRVEMNAVPGLGSSGWCMQRSPCCSGTAETTFEMLLQYKYLLSFQPDTDTRLTIDTSNQS